jgi:hypothetical protein
VEIHGYDKMSKKELGDNGQLAKTVSAWQPDKLEYLLNDSSSRTAFGDLASWIIYSRAPGEDIVDVDEERCWLLYEGQAEIIKGESSGLINEEIISKKKTDYRTKQWEKALPIVKIFYNNNPSITLPEIKEDKGRSSLRGLLPGGGAQR